MRFTRKFSLVLSCLSLVMLTSLAATAHAAEKKKGTSKKTAAAPSTAANAVAKVNGTVITREELDRAMKVMLTQTGAGENLTSEQKKTAETAVLDQLITAEILYQAGRRLEIKDIESKVTTQIDKARAKFQSPAQFEKSLQDNGITVHELKEYARKEIYISNLIETQIAPNVTVSDAEIKQFYDQNPDKFKVPESVRASHILIGTDAKSTGEEKKKAKEKAEIVLKKVKEGEDFATAAKENSTCPSSTQGGDLGFFTKGQMVPEFENAAFALKPNDVSPVIETQFGFHIIKVTESRPATTISFDEAKQKIADFLKNQKMSKHINEYAEKLRKEGTVQILAS